MNNAIIAAGVVLGIVSMPIIAGFLFGLYRRVMGHE